MKILLFNEKSIEPFAIHHDPKDVCCINDVVTIGNHNNGENYKLLHKDLLWTETNGISEVCVVLYVEEKSQK